MFDPFCQDDCCWRPLPVELWFGGAASLSRGRSAVDIRSCRGDWASRSLSRRVVPARCTVGFGGWQSWCLRPGGGMFGVLLVGCGTGCRSDRWRFGSEWVGLGGCSGAVRPARTQGVGGRGLSALMAARSVEGMPVDPPAFPRPGDHGPAALAGRRREWAATTDWLDCLSGAVVFSQAASRWGLAGRGFFRPRSPLRRRDFAGHGSVPLSAASRC